MIKLENIKDRFPFFKNNPDIIYFDNAATTQKPDKVIEKINDYYTNKCYNVDRGKYKPANDLFLEIKEIRQKIAYFLNANYVDEVNFVSGSSSISNLLSILFGIGSLKFGDEIMLCMNDHKQAVSSWVNIANILKEKNIKVVPILIDNEGDYNELDLYSKLSDKTKLVILTHIHNVYGMNMGLEEIIVNIRKNSNARVVVDATQSIAHIKVDVKSLDADALYFSGHKMFAETGIGVLWIKEEFNKELIGLWGKKEESSHQLFELGTPNISGILSLGGAIDFINEIGIDNIERHILELTTYLIDKLREIEIIEFDKGPAVCKCVIGYGIVSFKIDGFDVSEVAEALSLNNIYVRADNQCMYNHNDKYLRVSLQIYNTKEEIDRFVNILKDILEMKV